MMPHLGDCKKMAEHFDCTPQTISNALNFNSNSPMAKEIRQYAIDKLKGRKVIFHEE